MPRTVKVQMTLDDDGVITSLESQGQAYAETGGKAESAAEDIRSYEVASDSAAEASEEASDAMRDQATAAESTATDVGSAAEAQEQYAQAASTTSGQGTKANQVLFAAGDAAQDAQFGLKGAANNLVFVAESFSEMASEAGSAKAALGSVVGSLTGIGGLMLALQALLVIGPQIISFFSSTSEEAEGAADAVDELPDALEGLSPIVQELSREVKGLNDELQRLQDTRLTGFGGTVSSLLFGSGADPQKAIDQLTENPDPEFGPKQPKLDLPSMRKEAVETVRGRINEIISISEEARPAIKDAIGAERFQTIMNGVPAAAREAIQEVKGELRNAFSDPAELVALDENFIASQIDRALEQARNRLDAQEDLGIDLTETDRLKEKRDQLESLLTSLAESREDVDLNADVFDPLRNRIRSLNEQLDEAEGQATDTSDAYQEMISKMRSEIQNVDDIGSLPEELIPEELNTKGERLRKKIQAILSTVQNLQAEEGIEISADDEAIQSMLQRVRALRAELTQMETRQPSDAEAADPADPEEMDTGDSIRERSSQVKPLPTTDEGLSFAEGLNDALDKLEGQEAVIDAISSSFTDLGKAIGQGENVMEAFGATAMQVLTDIGKAIGKQLIAQGTAMLAAGLFGDGTKAAQGATLIAVGTGLMATSSAMSSAFDGGGSGPGSSASTQGGVTGEGGEVDGTVDVPGRRAGGPVTAGQLYETHGLGQREFFRPGVDGSVVVPSREGLPSGGRRKMDIQVEANGSIEAESFDVAEIRARINQLDTEIEQLR